MAALSDETQRELLAGLSQLNEKDRLVIAYRYFFDMSEAEMAAALDCRPGTVKSRLSRALARLREGLTAIEGRPATTVESQSGERRG